MKANRPFALGNRLNQDITAGTITDRSVPKEELRSSIESNVISEDPGTFIKPT